MADEKQEFARGLTRLNTAWLALSVAVLAALGLFVATIVLVLQGGHPSIHLSLLSQYFPGYTVTLAGAFVGAFWASLLGFIVTVPGGLFYYRRMLNQAAPPPRLTSGELEDSLGKSSLRIDLISISVAAGLTCGTGIFAATAMLLLNHTPGTPLGPNLSLLGQILPGYSVAWSGGLVGFAYLSAIGGFCALCVGWIYNRIT